MAVIAGRVFVALSRKKSSLYRSLVSEWRPRRSLELAAVQIDQNTLRVLGWNPTSRLHDVSLDAGDHFRSNLHGNRFAQPLDAGLHELIIEVAARFLDVL